MENKNILQEIQSELKAPKGQRNNFGNYQYRSAEDILEAVKITTIQVVWFAESSPWRVTPSWVVLRIASVGSARAPPLAYQAYWEAWRIT